MIKKMTFFCTAVLLINISAFAGQSSLKLNVFPTPPNLTAHVQFSEPSGKNVLQADETGKLIINIQNSGRGDAFDVKLEIREDKKVEGLTFETDVLIGTVPAGKTITREIELRAAEEIASGKASFVLNIREASGFDAAPMKISFQTKGFDPPKLVIADLGIGDQKGTGRVEPMGIVTLTVRVQNVGYGDARDVTADVQLGQNVFITADSATHFDLGRIASGKFKDFKFVFYTNNRIGNGEKVPITVSLNEARPKFNTSQPLKLVMTAPQKIEEVIVKGENTERKPDIALAGGLSVDVDENIPEGQNAGKDDVAVIIGNRNYAASGSPDVEYANRDARIMKEYIIHTLGYDPENIIYAEDATLSKFNEIFGTEKDYKGRLFRWVKKDVSRVFVYYVGHGAPDIDSTEAYFVPVDANPDYIKSNGYRLQTFYDSLSRLPAKKITIVLDACFSGNSGKGMLFKNISPAMIRVKKEFRGPANAVVITSAAVDQVSTWYPEKRHSLFTYYFLKGLSGGADTNKNGEITVGEMQRYLKENVSYMAQRLSGKEQHPVVMGNKDDVITVIKK
jgi:hypothetical protein